MRLMFNHYNKSFLNKTNFTFDFDIECSGRFVHSHFAKLVDHHFDLDVDEYRLGYDKENYFH